MSNIVTFEQAKKLKELGFDMETDDIYWDDGDFEEGMGKYNYNQKDIPEYDNMISAPSVSDALQWIRDNKRIVCAVTISSGIRNTYNYDWYDDSDDINAKSGFNRGTLSSFPETESALLDELLTYFNKEK